MGEIQQYPSRNNRGRAQGAASATTTLRFSPANDNRPPRSPWRKWIALVLAASAAVLMWLGLGKA